MNTRIKIAISLLLPFTAMAQTVSGVYKINSLLGRINNSDTAYVVNFWATWCKPCVAELPAFDSLTALTRDQKVKVILVSLDFKEDLYKKVVPFLVRRKTQSTCVLLDEVNGNDFIDRISVNWSGAIPATLFKKGGKKFLIEKPLTLSELNNNLKSLESTTK